MATVMHLTEQELKDYHDVFETFERDQEGRITVSDVLNVAQRLGLPTNESDLRTLLANVDLQGNGKLDLDAFLSLMAVSHNSVNQRRQMEEEMRQAFRAFDHDGNGLIDQNELRTTMKKLGEKLSKNDVKAMMKAADKNGDGKIDYEEFIRMMYAK